MRLLAGVQFLALVCASLPLASVQAVASNVLAQSVAPVVAPVTGAAGAAPLSMPLGQGLGTLTPTLGPLNSALPSLQAPAATPSVSPTAAPIAVQAASPLAQVSAAAPVARQRAAVVRQGQAAAALEQKSEQAPLEVLEITVKQLAETEGDKAPVLSRLFTGGQSPSSVVEVSGAQAGQGRSSRLLKSSFLKKGSIVAVPAAAALALAASPDALSLLARAGSVVGNGLAIFLPMPQVYQTAKDGHSRGTPWSRALLMVAASLALGLVNAPVAGNMFWGVQNLFGAVVMLSIIPIGRWLESRGKGGLGLSKPAHPGLSLPARWLHHLRYDKALHATLLVVGLGVPLSLGLYYAAAALVPALLSAGLPATLHGTRHLLLLPMFAGAVTAGHLLGKGLYGRIKKLRSWSSWARDSLHAVSHVTIGAAALAVGVLAPTGLAWLVFPITIPKVTLLIQAVTGLMFLMMFLPDVGAMMRGKKSQSFSASFSLSFFASAVGMLIWTLYAALTNPAYSAGWWQFMIYSAINLLYAAVAFVSYRMAVKNGEPEPRP